MTFEDDPTYSYDLPYGYNADDFLWMLFGGYNDSVSVFEGSSVTLSNSEQLPTVYGSLAHYFDEMSAGELQLRGEILNDVDGNGDPIWVSVDSTKTFYADTSNYALFLDHADSAATADGISLPTRSNSHKIVYLYSGRVIANRNALHPRAHLWHNWYIMGERQGWSNGDPDIDKFAGIGTHAHEFGHTLYLQHPEGRWTGTNPYTSQPDTNSGGANSLSWCLMQSGMAGPELVDTGYHTAYRSCPEPINPFYRMDLGWPTVHSITTNTFSARIDPGPDNVYEIQAPNSSVYVLEHLTNTGFGQYISYYQFPSAPGLFIWRRQAGVYWPLSERPILIVADGDRVRDARDQDQYPTIHEYQCMLTDPFPGPNNVRHVSDYTEPGHLRQSTDNARYYDGNPDPGDSHIAIRNITNHGDSTTADILFNYWSGPITTNTTWSNDANGNPIYVGGDITVPSGVTLTISPGTEVTFAANSDDQSGGSDTNKCELIVEGALDVNGTSSDKVTFTSSAPTPQAGDWYGIVLNSGSSVDIDHATIAYAKYGIRNGEILYSNDLAVNHSTIRNCSTDGLRLEYWTGTATLENTTIKDSGSKGIYASTGGTLSLTADTLSNNGSYDAYLGGCVLQANRCIFEDNSGMAEHGIRANNVSGAVDSSEFSDNFVHVYVQSNNGGMTLSDSNFDMGAYHIYNSSADTAKAEDNYWGTTDATNIAGRMSGPVDFVPFDTTSVGKLILASGWEPLPTSFDLMQNFPNPFNPVTIIRYQIPRLSVKDQAKQERVVLDIYNLLGQRARRLVERTAMPGCYTVTWDSRDEESRALASGLYFCRMQVGSFVKTNKMLLLR